MSTSCDGLEYAYITSPQIPGCPAGVLISNRGDAKDPYDAYQASFLGDACHTSFITPPVTDRDSGIAWDGQFFYTSIAASTKINRIWSLDVFDQYGNPYLGGYTIKLINPPPPPYQPMLEDLSIDYARLNCFPPKFTVYSNGPANGQTYAYDIVNSVVSNSFVISTSQQQTAVTGFCYTVWVEQLDSLTRVDWSITTAPNGGTVFAHGTATPSNSMSDFLFNNDSHDLICTDPYGYTCDVYEESVPIPAVPLPPGTYFLNLAHAETTYSLGAYWDQNNGTNCTGFGCPSSAFINTSAPIPSEAFLIRSNLNPELSLASCVPSSSVGLLMQKPKVTAYVPLGNWRAGATGIQAVEIEPFTPPPTSITTNNVTNSCASNSVTGQTVCVANNTDVYLITGSTLNTTLTSGATAPANFSGGSCYNCGVAIDALHNQAVIEVGLSGSPSDSGLQILDLTGTCTSSSPFCTPFPLNYLVSENIQVDPYRNLYLSPSEKVTHVYDVITHSPPGTGDVLREYSETIALTHGGLDSAAEDCTTGIALSTIEETNSLFITDLTQATYVGGTWSAPYAITTFPEFGNMTNGTDGISVAPGTQLAIVTGESFGNEIGAVVLPASSGHGIPSFGDYVAAYLPNTPDGNSFSMGSDPHTVTAYVSPNDGRAYGVVGGWKLFVVNPRPTYLAVIDLQKLLNAPRCSGNCSLGPHEVNPTYNLLTNGVVRYVSVF